MNLIQYGVPREESIFVVVVFILVLIFGKRVLMRNCLNRVDLWTCLWGSVFIALTEVRGTAHCGKHHSQGFGPGLYMCREGARTQINMKAFIPSVC